MDYRVESVEAVEGHRLKVRWNDGLEATVDLGDLAARNPAYATLADPAVFANVRIYEFGHGIYWLGPDGSEIDICPDVLRAKADPAVANWIAGQERAWHARQAAE